MDIHLTDTNRFVHLFLNSTNELHRCLLNLFVKSHFKLSIILPIGKCIATNIATSSGGPGIFE